MPLLLYCVWIGKTRDADFPLQAYTSFNFKAAVKCKARCVFRIYYHFMDTGTALSQRVLLEYFFGATFAEEFLEDTAGAHGCKCQLEFASLQEAVGNAVWREKMEPLLQCRVRQDTNPHLDAHRGRASKLANQARFHIFMTYCQSAVAGNLGNCRVSFDYVLYLDTDTLLHPLFWPRIKALSQLPHGILMATYLRSGPTRLQSEHFTCDAKVGVHSCRSLVVNCSVLCLVGPRVTPQGVAALALVQSAYAVEAAKAVHGKTIEWSAAAKQAAQLMQQEKCLHLLADPQLFHPVPTWYTGGGVLGLARASAVVSLSGSLKDRYGAEFLEHFSQMLDAGSQPTAAQTLEAQGSVAPVHQRNAAMKASAKVVKDPDRVTYASCPAKLKPIWTKIFSKQCSISAEEKAVLDVKEASSPGKRTGLKSARVAGLRMVSLRLQSLKRKRSTGD